MAQKIGRNDPCHCGSGRKYKKCCLKNDDKVTHVDFAWQKLRRTEWEVVDKHLLPYLYKNFPEATAEEAWYDLIMEGDQPESVTEVLWDTLFVQWFLFNWTPGKHEASCRGCKNIPDQPIAKLYFEKHSNKLSEYQKLFLENMCKTHFSFYAVLEVLPEKSLTLKDILLGKEYVVKERSGTKGIHRGDIMFTRVVEIDGQAICVGSMPTVIPSRFHLDLLDFKQVLMERNGIKRLTANLLRNKLEFDVFVELWDIIDVIYSPPKMPILQNTDGEPWINCKVHYELRCSPEEALKALLPLTLDGAEKDFLEDAEYIKGKLVKVELPWLKRGNKKIKAWDNTVMGHITITSKKLVIEVNSEKRAKKIKDKIRKYLAEKVEYKATITESLEALLKDDKNQKKSKSLPATTAEEIAMIHDLSTKHWANWLDEKIPALHGLTPREAVSSKDGKQRLEALLLDFERRDRDFPNSPSKPDLNYLRRELGLL